MNTGEFIVTVLGIILGSSALTVLLNNLHDRWKLKQERKNNKEDKEEEKENKVNDLQSATDIQEERLVSLEDQVKYISEGIKYLLLDKILFLGSKYIRRNSISMEEKKILREMHKVYHNGLNGNGDADFIMRGVEAIIPDELKQSTAKNYDNEENNKTD